MLVAAGEWWDDVLEEHVEELESLWTRRRLALRDPGWTGAALAALDERIEAHTDALELAGEEAFAALRPALEGSETPQVLGAALPLLRMRTAEAAARVEAALAAADGEAREGLGLALCFAPLAAATPVLERVLASRAEGAVAAAALALAFHGQPARREKVVPLLASADPAARRLAWETVALLGPRTAATPGAEALHPDLRGALRAGMEDAEAPVREAAWVAAAWTRQRWLRDELGRAASARDASPFVRRLRAILARPEDVPSVRALAAGAAAPERMALLATLGSPRAVPEILDALSADDPAVASAAGLAFRRLTGVDVGSGTRVPLEEAADGEGELERLFAAEVELPDPARARAAWQALEGRLSSVARLACGRDASRAFAPADAEAADRQSFFEWALRAAFEGVARVGPADLDAFPWSAVRPGADDRGR